MSYYWSNREELFEKAKQNITIKVVKKKLLSIMKTIKKLWKKRQETSIKIWQMKRKNWKDDIQEIGTIN